MEENVDAANGEHVVMSRKRRGKKSSHCHLSLLTKVLQHW
jgi:hypothetical protein